MFYRINVRSTIINGNIKKANIMNFKFTQNYKNLCKRLGENNDALYGVLTIAASKGILRPTFTMMDKKQDKDSRRYTAFREATTGVVAFASYIITHKGMSKLVKPFCKKANIVGKEADVEKTLSLISVSLTALFVIPFICNKITKPLLDLFTKKKTTKEIDSIKPVSQQPTFGAQHKLYTYTNPKFVRPAFTNFGMRIGG